METEMHKPMTRKEMADKNEQYLLDFGTELRENGFRIMIPQKREGLAFERTTYFFFEKDNRVAYCQYNGSVDGIRFSTCHYPSTQNGNGVIYLSNCELTVKNAEDTLMFRSRWDNQPYKSLEEYSKKNSWCKYEIFEPIDQEDV